MQTPAMDFDEIDTTYAQEWDVLAPFGAAMYWWQPGRPLPKPDMAPILIGDWPDRDGAHGDDVATYVGGRVEWRPAIDLVRAWLRIDSERQLRADDTAPPA